MNDTIVAISTALGEAAISIVRLSGDEAISIANEVFKGSNLTKAKSHTIIYGHIFDGQQLWMKCWFQYLEAQKHSPKKMLWK